MNSGKKNAKSSCRVNFGFRRNPCLGSVWKKLVMHTYSIIPDCKVFQAWGALSFLFGIGVPEGPNRGACEQTTTDFWDPSELNFSTECSQVN